MRRYFAITAAWASLVLISYATLTRVGFVYAIYFKLAPIMRYPDIQLFAFFEHFIAFAVVGGLFFFAYPRHRVFIYFIVFGSVLTLETLQTLTPDRHGTVVDAVQKIIGGAFGILASRLIARYCHRRFPPRG